ncbi:MAG: SDR family NAD(P)-dependent oxidoreductase [Alphaproteobacteria bacterium]|nr:SDR family NAD(P)-dependent oxidoreductase [Alphaproteobacteria bacterium]
MAQAQRSVVVTGVSTGIGWGAAKVLTKAGFKVFGSVRKEADAKRLQTELGANFVPLIFDVTDEKAAKAATSVVRAGLNGQKLFGLVNNAGISVAGPLLYIPVDEFRKQLDVNLTGVLITTQAFAPLLGVDDSLKGKPGRIVNIGSVGGRNALPFIVPYNVSKFGLEGFSEGLRRELMLFGIDVILIAPGAVATAIWDKAEEIDVAPYAKTAYAEQLNRLKAFAAEQGKKGLKPEYLGRRIMQALTTSNPKVRCVVTPDKMQNFILTRAPKRTADRLVAGQLGLLPKKA